MLRLSEIRVIPALERSAKLVRLAQTHVGRALLLGALGLILFLSGDWLLWLVPLALVPSTFFPERRRELIALITLAFVLARPPSSFLDKLAYAERVPSMRLLQAAATAAALIACVGYLHAVGARAGSILGRRPVAVLLCMFSAGIIGLSLVPVRDGPIYLVAWALLAAFGRNLWFLCYSLKNRSPRPLQETIVEVGHFNPFWWGSSAGPGTPLPKGGIYLDRMEARGPEALAVCQLKGLKLVLWAALLFFAREALLSFAYGTPSFASAALGARGLRLPTLDDALASTAAGTPLPFYMNWVSLCVHFFLVKMLTLAVALHFAIGTCRIAGFQALRGMYRPFQARSFADFWNRIHFYFKELMVEFFFFPTFIRYFRRYPRLRLFAATFAAACGGNFFYHFMRSGLDGMATDGLFGTLARWRSYGLYSLLLALGITISQLRGGACSKRGGRLRSITTITFVVISYCLLGILEDGRGFSIRDRGRFFLNLFPFTPLWTLGDAQ